MVSTDLDDLIRRLHDKADNLHHGWGLYESSALMREAVTALYKARTEITEELCQVVEKFPETILYIYDRPGGPPGNSMVPTTREHLVEAMRKHWDRK